MRVVSLLPSATEILYALDVEPVGVSHECDHPPRATEKPAVNRTHVNPDASSTEINEQVAAAEEGDGVYTVDRETLAALEPDLIITQGVCDVCAVDEVLVTEAVADLGLDAEVLTMDIHSLPALFGTIEQVGQAVDREATAADLVASLDARVEAVAETVSDAAGADAPRVAVLDWLDPVMVAGHWVPEMVRRAGGRYDLEDAGAHSQPREWATVAEYDPKVIVLSPCGFELDQLRASLDEVTARPGWSSLAAVEREAVYLLDGHHYLNRSGPRLVDTQEYLAWMLHPDEFTKPPATAVQPLHAVVQ
jgi:iron complex transport system substrate-binding protein